MKSENLGHLLLVEDEPSLGFLTQALLAKKGFKVHWVKNGFEALDYLKNNPVDLAILDIMMPKMDGYALATHIKEKHPKVKFLFLSAKSLSQDVIRGLELGAIDYLRKPIDQQELVVRINSILKNKVSNKDKLAQDKILVVGNFTLDVTNQMLFHDNGREKLTDREAKLLAFFIQNKAKLMTHQVLLDAFWGHDDYFNRKSLNVFITRLRSYLKADDSLKIENVHGKGFIFWD